MGVPKKKKNQFAKGWEGYLMRAQGRNAPLEGGWWARGRANPCPFAQWEEKS